MAHDPQSDGLIDEQCSDPAPAQDSETRKAVPAWILSGVVHVAALGLMALVVTATTESFDEPPIRTVQLAQPPVPRVTPTIVEVPPSDLPIEVTIEKEVTNPVSALDVPVETFSCGETSDADVPKGRPEAQADTELGREGLAMAIGPGSGAMGMSGRPNGAGKTRALGLVGGTPGSEKAVGGALRWFKKHQSPNGQWDVDGYAANCSDPGARCEPGSEYTGEEGDIACTAYALLCYLGAGYDHRMPGSYRTTVKKGIDWLVSAQKGDGLWGNRNYEHAVATMAIAEAYAMTNDPALRGPAQKGVDVILARQSKDASGGYALGWDYTSPNPARMDASVSGWNVMALKSAAAGRLNVGSGMAGARQYLERAWKACNKGFTAKDPYTDTSTFPYVWNSQTDAVQVEPGAEQHDMASVGALCAVFLGVLNDDPMLNSLANHVMKYQTPTTYPCNTYYLYYNTLAMFQVGGKRWDTWNNVVRDMLVNAQRTDGECLAGSWDFEGTKFHGHKTGRLLSTAYVCLSLEVYYRYDQVSGKKPTKPSAL